MCLSRLMTLMCVRSNRANLCPSPGRPVSRGWFGTGFSELDLQMTRPSSRKPSRRVFRTLFRSSSKIAFSLETSSKNGLQKCLVDGTSEVHFLRMSRAKPQFLMNFGTKFGTTFWMASSAPAPTFGGQVRKTWSRTSLWIQASLEMDKGWPYMWRKVMVM